MTWSVGSGWKLGLAIVVVGLISFSATSSGAAPAAKGTLVASGGVNGRWSLKSCTVSPSQGVFALQLSFGPGR
ncbi:MAG: hypothetical protein WA614_07100, partial [Acidimicrobiales bacterium]